MEGYIMSNKIEIREKFKTLLIATGKSTVTKAEIKDISNGRERFPVVLEHLQC